jgi:hypothetical protein
MSKLNSDKLDAKHGGGAGWIRKPSASLRAKGAFIICSTNQETRRGNANEQESSDRR